MAFGAYVAHPVLTASGYPFQIDKAILNKVRLDPERDPTATRQLLNEYGFKEARPRAG